MRAGFVYLPRVSDVNITIFLLSICNEKMKWQHQTKTADKKQMLPEFLQAL